MSLEAAQELSIPELLRVLGEKLWIESSRLRGILLSPPFSATSLELEIESLEARAHDILKLLPSLRNKLPPVNSLPPEIISCVARCALEDDIDTRSIVPLTHVCQYWRNSIVSVPGNWALISSERKKLAALSLERAKVAPLTVYLMVHTRSPGFLDLLLPHTQNIVFLSVASFSTIEELTQVLPNFPKSMPNLRSLALVKSGQSDPSQSIDPFDFSAHTLKELTLSNIPLFPSILSIRTLTKFALRDCHLNIHLDALLNFLEESHLLESANLEIEFAEPSLRHSRRQTPIRNGLQHLFVTCDDAENIRTLISNIELRRGAALKIRYSGSYTRFGDVFSGIPMAHLSNLSSPIFMKYQSFPRSIRLLGPNGSFSYDGRSNSERCFGEFSLLPLGTIRELRLKCYGSWIYTDFRLSSFPSLEVLAVDGGATMLSFPAVSPDPAPSPFLKTIALLDCLFTEGFVAGLAQFASDRENATSTPLHRVIMVVSVGRLPTVAWTERLRKHVPVVEILKGRKLPEDLSRSARTR
ncbi:hypothetical protein BDM02DRAFT_3186179 [Thelephora ganbajun]|uniref:Uncharacterized protein n=1 Tax=Thelephora ganbajun TaxID=370292 RepID=A0ACB6ZJI6_THEGA|nr:hypothetical protein BDM02DRAFT_3186179 [Thelephora ganbajun]